MIKDAFKIKKRKRLYKLLGDLPPRNRPISARLIQKEDRENYVLEKLLLDLNGSEEVPAYLILPKNIKGKIPGILYHHTHGGRYKVGKDEVLESAPYLYKNPYANDLTELGYAVLAIDFWNFGDRHRASESELFKEMLWRGQVLWGMMVYDSLRTLDYLTTRPEIDCNRIGTVGMSMGSTMAWWIAALDTRIKVCVDICCLSEFHSLIVNKALDRHGLYYFVPKLLKEFDTAGINALISPRFHLSLAGNLDPLTPSQGLDKVDSTLKKVYAKQKNPQGWQLKRFDVGHKETEEMREEVLAFFEKWL